MPISLLTLPKLKTPEFSLPLLADIPSKEWQHLAFTMPQYHSTPSLLDRVIASLPGGLAPHVQRIWDRHSYSAVSTHSSRIPRLSNAQRWNSRRLVSLPHIFVVIWALVLLWGERWVFESAVQACRWENWERWVSRGFGWRGMC
jgi:hypothetical protein